ncbi:MAG: hypothetical protein Q4B68_07725 [Bacteroidales bacterium]|nr:hypothetical protein [Bacteroidales bacterium]
MIEIIDISMFSLKLKATIQKSGRLGFTRDTANAIGCNKEISVKFARDSEDGDALYMIVSEKGATNSLSVSKAGEYYYVQAKLLFDSLGIDYKTQTVMFDLVRMSNLDINLGGQVYKLNKRIICKKEKNN